MPDIRPISDLRSRFAEISRLAHQSGEPVFLTKNGYGDLVVLSVEAYQNLLNQIKMQNTPPPLEIPKKMVSAYHQTSPGLSENLESSRLFFCKAGWFALWNAVSHLRGARTSGRAHRWLVRSAERTKMKNPA